MKAQYSQLRSRQRWSCWRPPIWMRYEWIRDNRHDRLIKRDDTYYSSLQIAHSILECTIHLVSMKKYRLVFMYSRKHNPKLLFSDFSLFYLLFAVCLVGIVFKFVIKIIIVILLYENCMMIKIFLKKRTFLKLLHERSLLILIIRLVYIFINERNSSL